MADDCQDSVPEVLLALFEEIRRIAPEVPDDTGFVVPGGVDFGEILQRFRAIPDGAGVPSLVAALNAPWPI
jgi:hypothetical protein